MNSVNLINVANVRAVLLAAMALAIGATMLAPGVSQARETMTDRCSSDVAFTQNYNGKPDDSFTIVLKRPKNGYSYWTPPFRINTSGSGRIRWWCNSTRGNFFDIGTYRVKKFGVVFKYSDGRWKLGKPDIVLGSSAHKGWTPERSRCSNRSNRIRARLGPDRLLQIQCLNR